MAFVDLNSVKQGSFSEVRHGIPLSSRVYFETYDLEALESPIVLASNERWVFCYDLFLKATPESANGQFSMREVATNLSAMIDQQSAFRVYREDTQVFRLTDVLYSDGDAVCFLIQLGDKNGSDPVFANLATGELRMEPKLDGEGIALSSHFMISLVSSDADGMRFHAVMEEVPGITKSRVAPFFTSLLKEAFEGYTFLDPDTGYEHKSRPTFSLTGRPSQSLEESLEEGVLKGLTLVRHEVVDGIMDEDPYSQFVEHTLRIQVIAQPATGVERVTWLNRWRQRATENGFDQLKVTYKRPEGRQKTVTMEREEDAANALFTRQEQFILDGNINQCEREIHQELFNKMVLLLRTL
ncbi:hypothetical protein [Aeromonas salmonicida]|uniref:hypothetical protein n=1 Tax=Aeromonas salmonicida TaxID=645 RepID=UPI000F778989|nr:hypothetical protein [Aeromonas salmonicida]